MRRLSVTLDYPQIANRSMELGRQLLHRGDPKGPERVRELLEVRSLRAGLQSKLMESRAKHATSPSAREETRALKAQFDEASNKLESLALSFPNWTHPDVPIGPEKNARVLKASSPFTPRFPLKDHHFITKALRLTNFEKAAKTTGAKFVYLTREAALLETALQSLVLQRLTRLHGFVPLAVPDVVRTKYLQHCGFQPRGENSQVYHVQDTELSLMGTSEISLAAYLENERLKPKQVTRLAGQSHCFRNEAGGNGVTSKGLYRLHQFTKVEMFVACDPKESERLHRELLSFVIDLCEDLGLTWRALDMPTEELGASAYRKYDVEVWMPGSKRWGEIASITNCLDYQARRLNIKMTKLPTETESTFAHTLNGTALAVPRILMALLETHQQQPSASQDGSESEEESVRVSLPKSVADAAGFDAVPIPDHEWPEHP